MVPIGSLFHWKLLPSYVAESTGISVLGIFHPELYVFKISILGFYNVKRRMIDRVVEVNKLVF